VTLPLIFPPSSLPLFLGRGIGVTLGDDFAGVARGSGHSRKRPKSSGKPRTVSVAWQLTYAQMIELDLWGEQALNVWTEEFTAEVPNMGPGRLFWRARWAEMPRMRPQGTPRGPEWAVTGTLILYGEGAASRPSTGALSGEILIARLGSGLLVLPATPLAGEILIARIAVTLLAGEIVIALTSTILPLAGEIVIARTGSGSLSAGGGGGSGGTIIVGEEDGTPLQAVATILFPNGTLSIDSDDTAIYTPSASGSGKQTFYQSSDPGTDASIHDDWIDSDTGIKYTRIDDGSSIQWVEF